jgi:uncharacterized membrane protein YciS (DUF1049 family)
MSLSVLVKKYIIALFIAVLGLYALVYGMTSNQDTLFNLAAANLMIGGVLAMLFSAGILKRNVVFGIALVCVAITIYFGYSAVNSVNAAIQHQKDRERSDQLVRFTLTQIRDIQRAHRNEFGRYAATWDEFETFFNEGKITVIESEKTVPAIRLNKEEIKLLYGDNRAIDQNITEQEAARLAALGNPTNRPELVGFKRDTVRKLYNEEYLGSLSREKERLRLGINNFKIENLRYIPMTNPKVEWTLETRENLPYAGDTISTIFVHGEEPVPFLMGGKKDRVGFGNLRTNSDKATWE